MILSDRDIRAEIESGRITIDPYDERCIQPSSVDLHVDSQFRVFANSRYPYIDVREEQPDLTDLVEVKPDEPFILHPGEFVLGSTLERVFHGAVESHPTGQTKVCRPGYKPSQVSAIFC